VKNPEREQRNQFSFAFLMLRPEDVRQDQLSLDEQQLRLVGMVLHPGYAGTGANHKSQSPSPKQIQNPMLQFQKQPHNDGKRVRNSLRSLEIWSFDIVWSLGFCVWNLCRTPVG
jgi:hypothetical protein